MPEDNVDIRDVQRRSSADVSATEIRVVRREQVRKQSLGFILTS